MPLQKYEKKHEIQMIVAVAVITNDENNILVCLRNDPRNKRFDKKWELPGGGLNKGETFEQALRREMKEEIGCDIKVEEVIPYIRTSSRDGAKTNLMIYVLAFHATIINGKPKADDKEILECRWVTLDELRRLPVMPGTVKVVETLFS